MTQEKLLDKLAKMKRMADGAKAIGSEAEAQAFAEALQRMLLDHKLSMSDIDFETMEKDTPVETHRIDYSKYDMAPKKTRVLWIEDLAVIVARAHCCKILVHSGSSRITLVGKKEDTTVAEYMLITLQRAAEKISNRAYDAYRNEERKKMIEAEGDAGRHGSMPHTFGFRESFINGFIGRLRDRMKERASEVIASTSTGLMRINRSEAAVEDFMKSLGTKSATALSRDSAFHGEGIRRGRAAADAVDLSGRAIGKSAVNRGRLGE